MITFLNNNWKLVSIGGLLCPEAAAASESFTLTVGLGDDLVMRLGVDSIENLRTDLLTAIRCCMLPKVIFTNKFKPLKNLKKKTFSISSVSSIVKRLHVRHLRSARPRLGAVVGDCWREAGQDSDQAVQGHSQTSDGTAAVNGSLSTCLQRWQKEVFRTKTLFPRKNSAHHKVQKLR